MIAPRTEPDEKMQEAARRAAKRAEAARNDIGSLAEGKVVTVV